MFMPASFLDVVGVSVLEMCRVGRSRSTEESRSDPKGENAEPEEVPKRVDGGAVRSEGRPRGGVTSRRMRTRDVGVKLRSLSEAKPSEPTGGNRRGEEVRNREGSEKGLVLGALPETSVGVGMRKGEFDRAASIITPKLCGFGLPWVSDGGIRNGDTFRVESIITPNEGNAFAP